MINEQEIKTGIKSDLPRSITAEAAAENADVAAILERRFALFDKLCQSFVDVIIGSLDQLPYGLRWLCKQIRDLCLVRSSFPFLLPLWCFGCLILFSD